jgi:integrase
MALTVKGISKLTEAGRYGDGGGLYLQIAPTGARSWILRYQRAGRQRWLGLGPLRDCSLDDARQRATRARQQLWNGVDPVDARRADRAALILQDAKRISFADAAQQYFNDNAVKWTNAEHRRQFLSSLEQYAFPIIGKLPVADVDTGLVLKVIDPLWKAKTVTADRVRNRIEIVLKWAKGRGYRTGDNPAAWKGHLDAVLPAKAKVNKVEHHAAMPYADVAAFVVDLRARQGIDARALEFLILTAARTSEVLLARWDEIDLANKIWIVPAERMKGRREHRVPLCDRAIAILKALPTEAEFVFAGARKGKPLGKMAMSNVLASFDKDATVHGFRSSFRDWAAEQTSYPSDIIEGCLAHTDGSITKKAYLRSDVLDKRRKLLAVWGNYVLMPRREASVTGIRARFG